MATLSAQENKGSNRGSKGQCFVLPAAVCGVLQAPVGPAHCSGGVWSAQLHAYKDQLGAPARRPFVRASRRVQVSRGYLKPMEVHFRSAKTYCMPYGMHVGRIILASSAKRTLKFMYSGRKQQCDFCECI